MMQTQSPYQHKFENEIELAEDLLYITRDDENELAIDCQLYVVILSTRLAISASIKIQRRTNQWRQKRPSILSTNSQMAITSRQDKAAIYLP